jgi:hypothetical protein
LQLSHAARIQAATIRTRLPAADFTISPVVLMILATRRCEPGERLGQYRQLRQEDSNSLAGLD